MSTRLQLIASGFAAARAARAIGKIKLANLILTETAANVAALQAAEDDAKVLRFPNSKRTGHAPA